MVRATKRWKPEEEKYVIVIVDGREKLPVEEVFVIEADRYILQRYLDRGQTHVRVYTAGIYRWPYDPRLVKDEATWEQFLDDARHGEPIERTEQNLDSGGAREDAIRTAKAAGYVVLDAASLY